MQKQKRREDMEAVKDKSFPFAVVAPKEQPNIADENSKEKGEPDTAPHISRFNYLLLWLGVKTMAPNSPKGIQWTAPNITLMLFIAGLLVGGGVWYGGQLERDRQRDEKILILEGASRQTQQVLFSSGIDPNATPTPTPETKRSKK